VSTKLVERLPARVVAVPGFLIAAGGLLWLSGLAAGSSYVAHVLPALFMTYFGLGMGFMPLTLTAVQGVPDEQAGVASAMLNTAQQIGAALAVAVLATIASSVANRQLPEAGRALLQGLGGGDPGLVSRASEALTQGYTSAFRAGAALLVMAAVMVAVMVNTTRTQRAGDT
jgi:hypothetical protein